MDEPPLSSVFNVFSDENTTLQGIYNIVARFIKEIWQKNILQNRKEQITIRMLDKLSHRSGGLQIINTLFHELNAIFGLDVINARNVSSIIKNWKSSVGKGIIYVPKYTWN